MVVRNDFVLKNMKFVMSATELSQLPKYASPEVAFLGRSNVGKSSLLNYLTNIRGLARVSTSPGRTRCINVFSGNLNESPFYLVDLPGFGYAKVSHSERDTMSSILHDYLEYRDSLKAVFHLFDCRRDANEQDIEIATMLRSKNIPYCLAITKLDKIVLSKRMGVITKLAEAFGCEQEKYVFPTSVKEKFGKEKILERISEWL